MGSLVSGLFDMFSGDPAESQRGKFDSLANYQTGVGEGLTTAGAGYEEAILSGDPTRIAQALAPEISTGQGQVEQQRLQDANFGNRSGGTAASTEAAEGANRANIINLEGGLQSSTANSAVNQGTNLMGEASSNIGSSANLAEQRRSQLNQDVGGIASGVAQIASGFMGGGADESSGIDTASFSDLMQSGAVQPKQLDLSTMVPQEEQMPE
jgi:hypothetical protein